MEGGGGALPARVKRATMQEFHDRTPGDIARYPMVPIRDVVVFPQTKAAFVIGRIAAYVFR